MKKLILSIWFALAAILVCQAQWGEEELDEQSNWQDRIFTGGGFGLSFSREIDFVSVSPLIGYRINQRLAAGVGLQYQYAKYKLFNPDFTTNNYGASVFTRYNFYGPLFLHAEYEYLNYEFRVSIAESERRGYNSIFGGGGLFQPLGRNAGLFVTVLYNFSYNTPGPNDFFPYDSPWVIRAGITAGFGF